MASEGSELERLMKATRTLIANTVDEAMQDIDTAEALIKRATLALAEHCGTVEALIREQRDRLEQTRSVFAEEAGALRAHEAVRYALEEEAEISGQLVQQAEGHLAKALEILRFEHDASMVMTGALARLAQLAETFDASLARHAHDPEAMVSSIEGAGESQFLDQEPAEPQ